MDKYLVKMKLGVEAAPQNLADTIRGEIARQQTYLDTQQRQRELAAAQYATTTLPELYASSSSSSSSSAPPPPPHSPQQSHVRQLPPLSRHVDGSCIEPPTPTTTTTTKMLYVEDTVSGIWPRRTDELCRWDMHRFEGTPIGLPISYDQRTRTFLLLGYWCSFNCLLAWVDDRYSSDIHRYTLYRRHIALLASDFYGFGCSAELPMSLLHAAPPREKLSYLCARNIREGRPNAERDALAEFRGDSAEKLYHPHPPAPFVRVTQVVDEQQRVQERDKQHRERVDLMTKEPIPIACTDRGQREQRKFVLQRQNSGAQPRGAIDDLMNIFYVTPSSSVRGPTTTSSSSSVNQ